MLRTEKQLFILQTTSSSFHPHPSLCRRQCLTDIDRTAPIHLQLPYPPWHLPLNCTISSSKHPQQTHLLHLSFTKQVYEHYSVILKAVPSDSENEASYIQYQRHALIPLCTFLTVSLHNISHILFKFFQAFPWWCLCKVLFMSSSDNGSEHNPKKVK